MKSHAWLKHLTRVAIILSIFVVPTRLDAAAASYQLNETIEVSTTGAWDRASIIEIGAAGGEHEGQYKVHFIGYAASYDRWLLPVYFRKVIPKVASAGVTKAAYHRDERIEVSTTGAWDKATIIDVGTAGGEHEGEYKVHFEGYAANYDRWLLPVYFRKVAGGEPTTPAAPRPAATSTGSSSTPDLQRVTTPQSASVPRLGNYHIMSYGAVGNPPLFLGHIELLAGGKYRISHKRSGDYYGEGTYVFDAATNMVKWLSGPCKDNAWSGSFTIERAGKTHKIRLRSTTTATNSVD
ncbi:MAG: hypothetical protein KA271_04505 [Propionivibrio sp.]|nr:hypothetical protein [Propionivibrio sp.]